MTHNLEKIRIKCAELVGWKQIHSGHWCRDIREGVLWELPNYPVSADAALELVAWMARPENGGWSILASNVTGKQFFSFVSTNAAAHTASADTLPLAICLAFLKANNINPETL